MKYRLIGLVGAILVVLAVFLAGMFDDESPDERIHQHRTSRQPDAGCDCDGSELCTHLPLVLIDTGGEEIPGKPLGTHEDRTYSKTSDGSTMLKAKIAVISDEKRNHHPSDTPDLESDILIRIRGNSSRHYEKKNYLVRLTDEDGSYQDKEMMGMDAHYEWAMHGPYIDKSLIRNYMWYNIAGEFMGYAPNVRFCEVILNGEYQGLYVMTETITNGDHCRIDVSEPVDGTTKTGYLLRLDRGSQNDTKNLLTFLNYTFVNRGKFDIQYPRSGDLTPEMIEAINQEVADFEKSLYSYDYDTDDYGYYYDLDVQSFVDYFILNEFTANYDAGMFSTYMYRDIGERYHMVIWDFNMACDNYEAQTVSPQHFEMQEAVWYFMLMKDEYFVTNIVERYHDLRKKWLSEEYLNQYIDETLAYLGPAIDRNFSVWGGSFTDFRTLQPEERNPDDYDEAIEQLRTFIHNRGEWMDKYIETLYQYSHESKNKKFNH